MKRSLLFISLLLLLLMPVVSMAQEKTEIKPAEKTEIPAKEKTGEFEIVPGKSIGEFSVEDGKETIKQKLNSVFGNPEIKIDKNIMQAESSDGKMLFNVTFAGSAVNEMILLEPGAVATYNKQKITIGKTSFPELKKIFLTGALKDTTDEGGPSRAFIQHNLGMYFSMSPSTEPDPICTDNPEKNIKCFVVDGISLKKKEIKTKTNAPVSKKSNYKPINQKI